MMDTRHIDRVKARLEARRAALLATRDGNMRGGDDLLAEKEPDFLDTSAERTAATVLDRLASSELEEVLRIDAALWRIEAGRWGVCESCGDLIAPARLEAVPEAARCLECASLREIHP